MAYIGNNNLPFDPTRTAAQPRDAERFSGNGSTTNFTLTRTPPNGAIDVTVYVENVAQEPITAYDVVGNSLNFTEAPPTGTYNIYVVYRSYQSGAQIIMPDGSVSYNKLANNLRLFTTDNLTPDGSLVTFNLTEPPADANTVFVTVDGMVQRAPVHYTTSGSTITFTSAPPVGSNVHVRHLGFRTTQAITAIPANTFIAQANIASPTISSPVVSGNANFDSNTLFVDSVNHRIGAGTTQPADKFHQVSSNAFSRLTVETTGNYQNGLRLKRTGGSYNSEWEIYTAGTSPHLRLYNGADTHLFTSDGRQYFGRAGLTGVNYDMVVARTYTLPSMSNGSWYTVGDGGNLEQGTYMMSVSYFSNSDTAGSQYAMAYYAGPFYMYGAGSNDGEALTIPVTYGGHAQNSSGLSVRMVMGVSSAYSYVQVSPQGWSYTNNINAAVVTFFKYNNLSS